MINHDDLQGLKKKKAPGEYDKNDTKSLTKNEWYKFNDCITFVYVVSWSHKSMIHMNTAEMDSIGLYIRNFGNACKIHN